MSSEVKSKLQGIKLTDIDGNQAQNLSGIDKVDLTTRMRVDESVVGQH